MKELFPVEETKTEDRRGVAGRQIAVWIGKCKDWDLPDDTTDFNAGNKLEWALKEKFRENKFSDAETRVLMRDPEFAKPAIKAFGESLDANDLTHPESNYKAHLDKEWKKELTTLETTAREPTLDSIVKVVYKTLTTAIDQMRKTEAIVGRLQREYPGQDGKQGPTMGRAPVSINALGSGGYHRDYGENTEGRGRNRASSQDRRDYHDRGRSSRSRSPTPFDSKLNATCKHCNKPRHKETQCLFKNKAHPDVNNENKPFSQSTIGLRHLAISFVIKGARPSHFYATRYRKFIYILASCSLKFSN